MPVPPSISAEPKTKVLSPLRAAKRRTAVAVRDVLNPSCTTVPDPGRGRVQALAHRAPDRAAAAALALAHGPSI